MADTHNDGCAGACAQTGDAAASDDGLKSRKLWVAVGPLFFILIAATVFAFLVGEKAGPVWHGRLSADQWVDLAKWTGWVVGVYVLGNVAEKGVAALALFTKKPPQAK